MSEFSKFLVASDSRKRQQERDIERSASERVKVEELFTSSCLLIALVFGTGETTGSAGGDETDFTTGGSVTTHGRSHTDVLMVTTTVGMLNGVHGHTTNLGPGVPLGLVLEIGSSGLEQRLIDTTTAGDDSHHSAIVGRQSLLGTRGQLDLGLVLVGVVGDDGSVVAGSSGEFAAISQLLLQLADDGSLGHGAHGHHVADGQTGLLAAVHELTRVHTLDGDERLLALLESVRISELNDGQRCATAGVVNDVLDNSLDVAVTLGIVGGAETGGAFAMFVVGRKNRPRSLTLRTNHSSHGYSLSSIARKKY